MNADAKYLRDSRLADQLTRKKSEPVMPRMATRATMAALEQAERDAERAAIGAPLENAPAPQQTKEQRIEELRASGASPMALIAAGANPDEVTAEIIARVNARAAAGYPQAEPEPPPQPVDVAAERKRTAESELAKLYAKQQGASRRPGWRETNDKIIELEQELFGDQRK